MPSWRGAQLSTGTTLHLPLPLPLRGAETCMKIPGLAKHLGEIRTKLSDEYQPKLYSPILN
jgi:hypothetical protein